MLSFTIPSDHVWRHFPDSKQSGSVFYAKSPAEVLTAVATTFPETFKHTQPDADGRKRLSFTLDYEIGLCNIVALEELTPQEKTSITEEERDGVMVKVVYTSRKFPTRELQIILSNDNVLITMFPGPIAPPLPNIGEHSEFWDNHIFIKSTSSEK